MPYAYYQKLNAKQKVIYRRSDSITTIPLTNSKSLLTPLEQLKMALIAEERRETESILKILAKGILTNLKVAPINIKLLAARPSHDWGELHGLYEVSEEKCRAQITLWMRTAQQKKVVAFRTFLRTFLHELCHHLDYELLELDDSFHTQGFFKRESSLFKQLVPQKTK